MGLFCMGARRGSIAVFAGRRGAVVAAISSPFWPGMVSPGRCHLGRRIIGRLGAVRWEGAAGAAARARVAVAATEIVPIRCGTGATYVVLAESMTHSGFAAEHRARDIGRDDRAAAVDVERALHREVCGVARLLGEVAPHARHAQPVVGAAVEHQHARLVGAQRARAVLWPLPCQSGAGATTPSIQSNRWILNRNQLQRCTPTDATNENKRSVTGARLVASHVSTGTGRSSASSDSNRRSPLMVRAQCPWHDQSRFR